MRDRQKGWAGFAAAVLTIGSVASFGRVVNQGSPSIAAPIFPVPEPATAPISHVTFVEVASAVGVDFVHRFDGNSNGANVSAGVAVGDYNGDGWLDLYLTQGDAGHNRLFENRSQPGDYAFVEVQGAAGAAGGRTDSASGPAFVDYDGDGDQDLVVGGVEGTALELFRNRGDGSFEQVTQDTGLEQLNRENNISVAFADCDQDGDLDLFVSHWTFTDDELPQGSTQHLWRNEGDGNFTDISDQSELTQQLIDLDKAGDFTFSPTFADIDNDGDLDLLVVADNTTSEVLLNETDPQTGSAVFRSITNRAVITDEAGMGSSVADFDNDGDLDWFVTSISLGDTVDRPTAENNAGYNLSGNRFYRNDGDGVFSDQTDVAGVRKGYWGWGSCAADFNNDGLLDIFHVNGMADPNTNAYLHDPSRLFINNGNGRFSERSESLGLVDRRSGRGVSCFDGDQDGDIDILVANNGGPARLFRNDGGNQFGFLNVRLLGPGANTDAVGTRVYLRSEGTTQMREVSIGSNYMSQNPTEQHFGLREAARADELRVVWPDGTETSRSAVNANQRILVTYPDQWSTE